MKKTVKKDPGAVLRRRGIWRGLISAENIKSAWLPALAGIAAGFVNGLLGAGGGVVIVRSATRVLPRGGEYTPRDVYASALAVMLPVSAVSAISYARLGVWDGTGAWTYILPALVGGIAGALLLDKLHTQLLRLIFSAVAAYSGIMMLFK